MKMDLRNCPQCGKLFAYTGSNKLCPVCRQTEEDDYKKVRDYLWDHPGATIEMVHEETGVERELIIKFIKEERLIAEGITIDFELECERCGTPIKQGRFCKKCQAELVKGFKEGTSKKSQKSNRKKRVEDRMYIADRIKKKK
jgi:flagellar operon protein (TIGR03826 family)